MRFTLHAKKPTDVRTEVITRRKLMRRSQCLPVFSMVHSRTWRRILAGSELRRRVAFKCPVVELAGVVGCRARLRSFPHAT